MLTFKIDERFYGYAVEFSPFIPSRFACAAAENYGLNGQGCLYILEKQRDVIVLVKIFFYSTGLYDFAWSENDENVIITVANNGFIQLWNVALEQGLVREFKGHRSEINSAVWSLTRDAPLFVTGSWDKTLKVWDSTNCQPVSIFDSHHGLVYCVSWSPHLPGVLMSSSGDGDIRIWDLRINQSTSVIPAGSGEVLCCDWTKYEPTIIASSGTDSTIRVWDLRRSIVPLRILRGHTYPARRIKCSPCQQNVIASVSYDKTLRIWDHSVASHPIETIKTHSEFVTGLDFNLKNDMEIADCSWDKTIQLHHLKTLPGPGPTH
eukprot:Seg2569.3 transcript_id=Seg2569.3/GoldUCD/mRNA.D3Y31 product="Peroxisomal targeting signal 2 receptor" protein_id=Seg2569.3/GoldUCD/D3Y31